ncbi:MAG: cyclic nucleotide-binding domain-containing protein [Betaproteobacteria bacterium]
MGENEQIIEVLKSSTPFNTLPEPLLATIAAFGRRVHYRAGETIYESGSAAEDIFLILRGEVNHSFDPEVAVARELTKTVGPGAVFGWAALLKEPVNPEPRQRLAKTLSLSDSDILIIDAQQLIAALASIPGAKENFMNRIASIVRHLYGFAGFVKVGDKFLPAYIPTSDTSVPHQYDTFAF